VETAQEFAEIAANALAEAEAKATEVTAKEVATHEKEDNT